MMRSRPRRCRRRGGSIRSSKLEQHAKAAARIAPGDLAARLEQDATRAAFETAVRRYFDLAEIVLGVAAGGTYFRHRQQIFRRDLMRFDCDMRLAGVDDVAILIELFFDAPEFLGHHQSPLECVSAPRPRQPEGVSE